MYEIQVSGMSCSGCVKSISNALQAADAKANVSVDLASQKVKIESHLDSQQLTAAIEEAGYGVLQIRNLEN